MKKRKLMISIMTAAFVISNVIAPFDIVQAEESTDAVSFHTAEAEMSVELSEPAGEETEDVITNEGEEEIAGIPEKKGSDEQEYVVVAANNVGLESVQEEYSEDISEDVEQSTIMTDNNIAVVTLSAGEADLLETDDNILLVEEDIYLCASSMEKETIKKEKKRKLEEQLEEETIETRDTPDEDYEWNLEAINAANVIESNDTKEHTIKVAVLDSGVDIVSGINLTGYVNFVDQEEEISPIFQDMTGHGTGIASIIAGNGETGVYGVNPNVELYSVKIMDENNRATLSRVIRGIYWCIENDINIINMSFGTTVYSQVLEKAVQDAYAAGILLVGAAGNGGQDIVEYPAAFPEVMAVASTNPDARISDFSNIGEEIDIAAPGEKIRVASYFDGSVVTHGTSIAVPHVVGVASLLWEKDPAKSNEFIRQLLNYSAKSIEGTDAYGLLDAEYALGLFDTFAENFQDTDIVKEENLPDNTATPEIFEEVNIDEAYVEGRWSRKTHKEMIDSSAAGFTTDELQLIKIGCVFPDNYGDWKEGEETRRWHGWWEEKGVLTNYVTICEMITDTALNAGKVQPYDTYSDYGLDYGIYGSLQKDINKLDFASVLAGYGYSNTAKNRKYFLYGCGIHTITDAMAHCTAEKQDGRYVRISHEAPGKPADDVEIRENRHKIASTIASYALKQLQEGIITDGEEVKKAIKKHLDGITPDFKMIDIKKNLVENGYNTDTTINSLNISSSNTYSINGNLLN